MTSYFSREFTPHTFAFLVSFDRVNMSNPKATKMLLTVAVFVVSCFWKRKGSETLLENLPKNLRK